MFLLIRPMKYGESGLQTTVTEIENFLHLDLSNLQMRDFMRTI